MHFSLSRAEFRAIYNNSRRKTVGDLLFLYSNFNSPKLGLTVEEMIEILYRKCSKCWMFHQKFGVHFSSDLMIFLRLATFHCSNLHFFNYLNLLNRLSRKKNSTTSLIALIPWMKSIEVRWQGDMDLTFVNLTKCFSVEFFWWWLGGNRQIQTV